MPRRRLHRIVRWRPGSPKTLDDSSARLVFGLMTRVRLLFGALFIAACNHGSPTSPLDTPCPGLPLGGSARVEGTVTHYGGTVAEASVLIGGRSTTTQPDGSFALADVPSGVQPVQVSSMGRVAASGDMYVLSSYNQVRISTAQADEGSLSGRTIDGCSGRTISGVVVKLSFKEATSGPDGLYEMDKLCCSTLGTLQASKPGYKTTTTALGRAYGTGFWLDLVMTPE